MIIYNIDVEDFIEKLKSVMEEYTKVDFHYNEDEKTIFIIPRRESAKKVIFKKIKKEFPDIWDMI